MGNTTSGKFDNEPINSLIKEHYHSNPEIYSNYTDLSNALKEIINKDKSASVKSPSTSTVKNWVNGFYTPDKKYWKYICHLAEKPFVDFLKENGYEDLIQKEELKKELSILNKQIDTYKEQIKNNEHQLNELENKLKLEKEKNTEIQEKIKAKLKQYYTLKKLQKKQKKTLILPTFNLQNEKKIALFNFFSILAAVLLGINSIIMILLNI